MATQQQLADAKKTLDKINSGLNEGVVGNGQMLKRNTQTGSIDITKLNQTPDLTDFPAYTPQEPTKTPNFSDLIKQGQQLFQEDQKSIDERARQQNILNTLQTGSSRVDLRNELTGTDEYKAKQKAFTNASSKLQRLQAEEDTLYDRMKEESMSRAGGEARTTGAVQGERTRRQRDIGIRKRYAAADFLAMQGDLQGAKEEINQAINDQFADRQDRITATKDQIAFLNKENERKGANKDKALAFALKERERLFNKEEKKLEREREEKKTVLELSLRARTNNAPEDVIARLQQAKTAEEAVAIGGAYLVDKKAQLQEQLLRQQIRTQKANRSIA